MDAGVHHLQRKAEGVSTTSTLADLIRDFLIERTGLLMRHEDVAQQADPLLARERQAVAEEADHGSALLFRQEGDAERHEPVDRIVIGEFDAHQFRAGPAVMVHGDSVRTRGGH